jgi:chromosomal replication initiator protein
MTPELMSDEAQATEASWGRVRSELLRTLGKDSFHNWIDPLVFRSARHGVIEFEAPTSFIGTWVERNYGETIRRLFARDGISVGRLHFGVAMPSLPPVRRRRPTRPPTTSPGHSVRRRGPTPTCRSRRSTAASPSRPSSSASRTNSPTRPPTGWPRAVR